MKTKIITSEKLLAAIPWEDRPVSCKDVMWRSEKNPIVLRDAVPCANSIFNSAVIPYKEGFAGVFRIDDKRRIQRLHRGFSTDGIHWDISNEPIQFICNDSELAVAFSRYDPRVCLIGDKYYVTWCNSYHGPTIGVAYTYDFEVFYQLENAFLPYNRNGVLFPRKINGNYAMVSRPCGPGHNAYGDIFYSESPDMEYWGRHRYVMGTTRGWQSTKIGAGSVPIETSEGWLMIYHGVLESCNGFVYSAGAALLDIDKPWKVLYRTSPYLLAPIKPYECVGDVPNVVFPCATLCEPETGKLTMYYGGADTVICMAYAWIDELVDFIKENSLV